MSYELLVYLFNYFSASLFFFLLPAPVLLSSSVLLAPAMPLVTRLYVLFAIEQPTPVIHNLYIPVSASCFQQEKLSVGGEDFLLHLFKQRTFLKTFKLILSFSSLCMDLKDQ